MERSVLVYPNKIELSSFEGNMNFSPISQIRICIMLIICFTEVFSVHNVPYFCSQY